MLAAAPLAVHLSTHIASATNLTWDPLQTGTGSDGAGNWDTTDKFWSNGSADSAWTNGASAIFGSNLDPAGTVTLTTPITANGLTFNNAASGNYTIAAAAPGDVLTIPNSAPITVAAGLSPTISAPIAVSTSNGMFFDGPGTLNISGASAYSAGNQINSGTVTIQTGGNLGSTSNSLTLAGTLNVNTSVTVNGLTVNPNTPAAATMNIAAGQTFTGGSIVSIGHLGTGTTTQFTATGGGSFVAGSPGSGGMTVGASTGGTTGNTTTVDFSQLNSFTFSVKSGAFNVGVGNLEQTTLTLATTSTITAGGLSVGTMAPANSSDSGTLNLGAGVNTINATTISIGTDASTGTVGWQSKTTTGTLSIAGTAGGATRANITVGSRSEAGTAGSSGNLLLDGHAISVLASTLTIGSNSGSSSESGSVAFDTGTFDVSTIDMAFTTGGGNGATLTVGSSPSSTAQLIVDSNGAGSGFSLADNDGTSNNLPPSCVGALDIKGGAADVNCDITVDTMHASGSNSVAGLIILEGGTLNMMGHNIGGTGQNTVTLFTKSGTLENVNSIDSTAGVTMSNAGSLTIDGTNNYSGPTSVEFGTLTLAGSGSIASAMITVAAGAKMNVNGTLASGATVNANGNVTFGPNPSTGFLSRNLAALNIGSGASVVVSYPSASGNRTVLSTSVVSFADNTGSLDLTSNDMILKGVGSAGFANVVSQITQGRNSGSHGLWTGAGITSSSAAATLGLAALAVELNNDGFGGTLLSTFDGQSVTNTDVLVKYTYAGDANLDGTVNGSDYALIDNGFNTRLSGWRNGDFNYDGVINGDDYLLIDNAFNSEGSVSYASIPAAPTEMIAADSAQVAQSAVPEPAILPLIPFALAVSRLRRRHA